MLLVLNNKCMSDFKARIWYHGLRKPDGSATVNRRTAEEDQKALRIRSDLHNHSPAGHNWGYGGSGPTQLALDLLADFFGPGRTNERLALAFYQAFKAAPGSICTTKANEWEITDIDICTTLSRMIIDEVAQASRLIRRARDERAFDLESEEIAKAKRLDDSLFEQCRDRANDETRTALETTFRMSNSFIDRLLKDFEPHPA